MGRKKGQSYVDMPPALDELKLSTVERLDRLQRELRASTVNLQRIGRERGFRCDSHEQVEAIAVDIERSEHGDLRHALRCYQGARARMMAEVRRSEVPNKVPNVTHRPARARAQPVKPSASRGAARAERRDLEPAHPAAPGQRRRVEP